ncbi:DJ-1/PfpI family protein [Bacteroides caecigallinarum]|uniref:DJ-1 family glyoxalase III n=1 Tax=Bacteroides caecigallinarum TaxID=1411144 RepID=UPI00195741AA|nr:DJ-1 family glyoxalase III [Bacteroides caecigallinarum]MBM6863881.1 DJ-1/PfpI family protein [Bacteroides caecigallinarum]MBU3807545.1 DJ-1/PfpI family protein [Candidatus Phocaeicola faecipullorum]
MNKICLFLAEGFEESEALLPLDILRRGGVNAITVSVTAEKTVKGSHGVPVVADAVIGEIKKEDVEMIILPGGLPGATNLDASSALDEIIMDAAAKGKLMAAICAAPMVYGKRGLLKGKKATCYPGFDKYLDGAEYTANLVEIQDNFILGKGPAAAAPFGFAILERLAGQDKAEEVKKGMLYI